MEETSNYSSLARRPPRPTKRASSQDLKRKKRLVNPYWTRSLY